MIKELVIVDDDYPFRERLSQSMERKGFNVESLSNFTETIKRIKDKKFDYAIVDMRLKDGSGLELIKNIKQVCPNTKSLLLTGYGNIATAVAAIKSGAIDYLPKPAEIEQIYDALTSSKEILPPPPVNPMTADRIRWEHIQRVFILCKRNVSETGDANQHLKGHKLYITRRVVYHK